MQIIKEKCDPKEALEKSLPYTSYLVEYIDKDNLVCYDIVISQKQVDVFDHYYDKYKAGLKKFHQTEVLVDPRRWVDQNKVKAEPPKKTRKRTPPPKDDKGTAQA